MDPIKQMSHEESETTEQERKFGPRDVLRNMAERRLKRGGARAVKAGRRRVRAFGRGASVGYAIQENPGKATAVGFVLGCLIGAIGLALTQVLTDFQTLVEEERPDESAEAEAA